MGHNVKGSLFVDYVRMMRGQKGLDWSRYLRASDLDYLTARIAADSWYPMETFERMGVAILAEVAKGDLSLVQQWGRMSIDWITLMHEHLVAVGDPRESLVRFSALRQSFFDYPALEMEAIHDDNAVMQIRYGMGRVAEEAASYQTLGFFERLLEVAGARNIQVAFASRSWAGDSATRITMRWERDMGARQNSDGTKTL